MQTTQTKSLLKDKELRKKIAGEIAQVFNTALGTEKFSKKEMEEFLNDEKVLENFKRCNDWVNLEEQKRSFVLELAKSKDKKITPSYVRYAYVLMDLSQTKEAEENNEKYINYMTNKDKSLEMADYIGKALFKTDYTKFIVSNMQQGMDAYFENPELIQIAHEASRVYKEQDAMIHPDLIKLYQHDTTLFETVSLPLYCKNIMANPLSLFLPYKEYSKEEQDKVIEAGMMVSQVLKKYESQVEELQDHSISSINKKSFSSAISMKYATDVVNLNILFKLYEPLNRMKEEGVFTNDFQLTKVFTSNGQPLTLKQGMDAISEGKNVEVMAFPDKDINRFKNALEENIAFDYKAMNQEFDALFEPLKEQYDALDKTKGFFTRDSKEFKNLNKELKPIIKEYNECMKKVNAQDSQVDKDLLKFKLLGKLYKKSEKSFEKIATLATDYTKYKQGQEKSGKVLNDRSKNRMRIVDQLQSSLKLDKIATKFTHNAIVQDDKIVRRNIKVDELNINKNVDLSKQVTVNKTKTKIKTISLE